MWAKSVNEAIHINVADCGNIWKKSVEISWNVNSVAVAKKKVRLCLFSLASYPDSTLISLAKLHSFALSSLNCVNC